MGKGGTGISPRSEDPGVCSREKAPQAQGRGPGPRVGPHGWGQCPREKRQAGPRPRGPAGLLVGGCAGPRGGSPPAGRPGGSAARVWEQQSQGPRGAGPKQVPV